MRTCCTFYKSLLICVNHNTSTNILHSSKTGKYILEYPPRRYLHFSLIKVPQLVSLSYSGDFDMSCDMVCMNTINCMYDV